MFHDDMPTHIDISHSPEHLHLNYEITFLSMPPLLPISLPSSPSHQHHYPPTPARPGVAVVGVLHRGVLGALHGKRDARDPRIAALGTLHAELAGEELQLQDAPLTSDRWGKKEGYSTGGRRGVGYSTVLVRFSAHCI